jgi:hypothetical protein
MKHMKFIVAILALTFVVGSSFKTKLVNEKEFLVQSKGSVSGQSNWRTYTVLAFDELTPTQQATIACTGTSTDCSYILDLDVVHFDSTPESSDYTDFDAIKISDAGAGASKVFHVRVSGGNDIRQDLVPGIFSYTP